MTTYFLGVEVPVDTRRRLSRTMRRLGDDHPLPHVTLVAPPLLDESLDWLEPMRSTASQFPRFELSFGAARTFDDRVLYLAVESAPLVELHSRLLTALGASPKQKAAHETSPYVAHLTLAVARGRRALPPYEAALAELGALHPIAVRSVVVFARGAGDAQYHARRRLRLATSNEP